MQPHLLTLDIIPSDTTLWCQRGDTKVVRGSAAHFSLLIKGAFGSRTFGWVVSLVRVHSFKGSADVFLPEFAIYVLLQTYSLKEVQAGHMLTNVNNRHSQNAFDRM